MTFLKKMMLAASLLLTSNFATATVQVHDFGLLNDGFGSGSGSGMTIFSIDTPGAFAFFSTFTLNQDSEVYLSSDSHFGNFSYLSLSMFKNSELIASAVDINRSLRIDDISLKTGDYTTVIFGQFDRSFEDEYGMDTGVISLEVMSTYYYDYEEPYNPEDFFYGDGNPYNPSEIPPVFGYQSFTSATVSAVPEASTLAMMFAGLGLVGFMARRRKLA